MRNRILALFILFSTGICLAQNKKKDEGNYKIPKEKTQNDTIKNKKDGHYYFDLLVDNEATGVKNQNKTGTCWSFSTLFVFRIRVNQDG